MAIQFLDKNGLTYFWNKIKTLLNGKSNTGHTHSASEVSGLKVVATSGSYNDLINKPTIPTVPSSLPANGGNADTVDNYHIRKVTDENDTGQIGCITFIV